MCTDTIPVLAYVKIELFFADICYYQRINPKPIINMAKKIAEQLNVSLKTVEFHITKALRILRVELKDYLASILLW